MRHGTRAEDGERARLLSTRHSRNLQHVYQEAAQDEPKPEEAPTDTTEDAAEANAAEERERRANKLGNNGDRRASKISNNNDERRRDSCADCGRFLDGRCKCLSCLIKNIMNNEYCGLSLLVLLFLLSVLLAFVFMTRTLDCVGAPAAPRQLKEPVHAIRLLRDTTDSLESAGAGDESWSGGQLLDANRFKRSSPTREGAGEERGGRSHRLSDDETRIQQRAGHAEPAAAPAAGKEATLTKLYEKLLKTDETLQHIKRMATNSEPDVRRARRSVDLPPRPGTHRPAADRPRLGRNSSTAKEDDGIDDGYGATGTVEQERVVFEIEAAPEALLPSHNANVAAKSPHAPETVTKSHEKELNHPFFKNSQHHDVILNKFIKMNFKHLQLTPDKDVKIMVKDDSGGSSDSDITTRKDSMSVWKDQQPTVKEVSGRMYDEDLDYTNIETRKPEPSEELEKVPYYRGYDVRSDESSFDGVQISNGMPKTRRLLQVNINEKDEIKFECPIDDSVSDGYSQSRKKRHKNDSFVIKNVNLNQTTPDNTLKTGSSENGEYTEDTEISKVIKKRESNDNNTNNDYRSIFRYVEETVSAIVRDPSIKENIQLEKRYDSQFIKEKNGINNKENVQAFNGELVKNTLGITNGNVESMEETTQYVFNALFNIGKIDANSKEGKLSQDYSDYGVLDEKKNYNMYEERKRSQPDDTHKKTQRSIDLRKNPTKHTKETTTTKEKLFAISFCSNNPNAKECCLSESLKNLFKFKVTKDKYPSILNVQPESGSSYKVTEMPGGYDSLIQLEDDLRSSEVRDKRVADLPYDFVLQEDNTEVNYNGPSNLEPSLETHLKQRVSEVGTGVDDEKRYNANDREDVDVKIQQTFKSRSLLSERLHNLDSEDEPFDHKTEIYYYSGNNVTENGLHFRVENQNRLYNKTNSAFECNDKLLNNESSYQDSNTPKKINKRSITQHKSNFATYPFEHKHIERSKKNLEDIYKPDKEYDNLSKEENVPKREPRRKSRRESSGVAQTEYEKVNTNQEHEDEDFGVETYRIEYDGVQNKEHNLKAKNDAKEKEHIHSKDEEILKMTPEDSSKTVIVESKTLDKFHNKNDHKFNTHNMAHFESIGDKIPLENIPSVEDFENREKVHSAAEHAKIRPLQHAKYTTKPITKVTTDNEHGKKSWIKQEWKKMINILNKPRVIDPYVTATTVGAYGMGKQSLLSLNHDSLESDSNALEEDTNRDMLRNSIRSFDKKDYGGVDEDGAGAVDWTRLTRQLEGVCARAFSEVAAVTRLDERSLMQYDKGLQSEQSVELMQKLVRLMGELVDYQAQRRSCQKLPADLQEFLVWLTSPASDSPPPPQDAPWQRQPVHTHPAELLNEEEAVSSSEYERTIRQLQEMLDEYNDLQEEDQSAMRGVRGYLADHISYLQRLRVAEAARAPRKLTVSLQGLDEVNDIRRFKREVNATHKQDALQEHKLEDKCETKKEAEKAQGNKEKKKHFHSRKRRRDCHRRIRKSPKSSKRHSTKVTLLRDENNEIAMVTNNV